MIKAIIVDDEPSATEVIKSLLTTIAPHVQVCDTCFNIKDAVHSIYKYLPDIVFLDIELADGSGFEVIDSFAELHSRIVFVTAFEHYALKAIKHNAFDYLLKPVVPEEFEKVIGRVTPRLKKMVLPILMPGSIIANCCHRKLQYPTGIVLTITRWQILYV